MMNEYGSSCAEGTAWTKNAATAAVATKPARWARAMALYGTAKRPRAQKSAWACDRLPRLEIELQGQPGEPWGHQPRRVQRLIALDGGRRRVVNGRRPHTVHEAAGDGAVVAVERIGVEEVVDVHT